MNVWNLAFNALSIAGLALLLAGLSYGDWAKHTSREGTRAGRAGLFAPVGLLLIGLGMAATSDGWLERAAWGLLVLLVVLRLAARRSPAPRLRERATRAPDYQPPT
ncbi:MAG TPA: hypothetical protein VF707_11655 [Ardenticatenaceae bacterium]|jgi:hypothetical protein